MLKGTPDDDRLSNLPDDVLLNILDRFNVRDAARTSVLSRRWRHLPSMLSRLVIDVRDFLPKGRSGRKHKAIVRCSATVVKATKSILSRRSSSQHSIRSLSMTFFLGDDDPTSIGHAVGHAMVNHKVETAEFEVLTERDATDCRGDHRVGYGTQFMWFFDACPDVFGGLTRLRLHNLRFGELDISDIFVTCKRLAHLHLSNCDSEKSTLLQIEHAQLTELSIVSCFFERVELVSLPKLTCFIFDGWNCFQDPLSLGYVPLLESVSFRNAASEKLIKLSEFLGDISVRDLKLGFQCQKIWIRPECLTKRLESVFHNLRFLNLRDIPAEGHDLTWTFFILEAAPNLKDLYMTVWDHLCTMKMGKENNRKASVEWEPSTSDFQHRSLETLVMFGFQGEHRMATYITRLMRATVNLEHAFLYPSPTCDKCHTNPAGNRFMYPVLNWDKCVMRNWITTGIDSSATIHFPGNKGIMADHLAKLNSPYPSVVSLRS